MATGTSRCTRLFTVAVLTFTGAAAADGPAKSAAVHHLVLRGQTLHAIARTYGVPLRTIARVNGLEDPSRIPAGARLLIPGARRALPVPGIARRRTLLPDWLERSLPWPVEGTVLSGFHVPRDGHLHQGIDIKADEGTPIRAVADGIVRIAAEGFGEHGRLVVVDHAGGLTTYYSHNLTNKVEVGQNVRTGDVLALVGRSGNARGCHLHFEVHAKGHPVDPRRALRGELAVASHLPDAEERREEAPPAAGSE